MMKQSGTDSSAAPFAPPAPPVSELMISKATSVTGQFIECVTLCSLFKQCESFAFRNSSQDSDLL